MNACDVDPPPNRRILVVDDNPAIHEDFKKILTPAGGRTDEGLAEVETALFGDGETSTPTPRKESLTVDSAFQGQEGLQRVEKALAEGRPYAMAFIDVRMPPGWDGIETIERIWKIDPALQIVISTAYSDYSWDAMIARLGQSDGLVILKKPFDPVEVLQLAHAFTAKWNLNRQAQLQMHDLEHIVDQRTKELQSEIAERKKTEAELATARDAAEAASQAKSSFLANMSHEIRTPMNGVLGMCQLLLDSNLTADQLDLANTLNASSESLLALLNDILDFSKIEADKLTLELVEFSLDELVDGTLQLLAAKADDKDLELIAKVDPSIPTRLVGDPTRLRQVLINLLSNALKFTSEGEVAVEVQRVRMLQNSVQLRFMVRDTGIGISAEHQAQLFQPFTQADSSITRRFGGTGLGLAICSRLVALMGGGIAVRSNPDKGSEFRFEITLDLAAPVPESPAHDLNAHAPRQLEDVRVLIAAAHSNRNLLTSHLKSWNIDCDATADAGAAMRALDEAGNPHRIAIIDHQLAKDGGLELVRQIRDHYSAEALRILLLTSRQKRPRQEELAALGIYTCLLKPLRKQALQTELIGAWQDTAPTKQVRRQEARKTAAPHETARILVAEDNPINQKLALLQLKQLGYTATVVPDGRAAVLAVQQSNYDLLLMDCQMPELDGFEATRAIREFEATRGFGHVPIIAMTAGAVLDDRDHCLACGMDGFIAKPVRREVLSSTLRQHLSPASSLSA